VKTKVYDLQLWIAKKVVLYRKRKELVDGSKHQSLIVSFACQLVPIVKWCLRNVNEPLYCLRVYMVTQFHAQ